MTKPLTISENALKSFLVDLTVTHVPLMPPAIERLVTDHRRQFPHSDWEQQPGKVVAEALAEVGRQIIFPNLRRKHAAATEWNYALAVFAEYLEPLLYDYLGEWTVYNAHQQLQDSQWLEQWVRSESEVDKIKKASTKHPRTFRRWRDKGLQIWCEGIRRWLSVERQVPNLGMVFARPSVVVPRHEQQEELNRLFEAALRSGQWLAVTGLPGIGKTTLIGEFLRNLRDNAEYVKRMFPGGVAAVSADRLNDEESAYLPALVAQITGELLTPTALPAQLLNKLRSHLDGNRALLVVDDVPNPTDLKRLRAILEVMVLVTLRSPDDALALDIPARWQMRIGSMTVGEGRELLCSISGREPEDNDEGQAMDTIVELLAGHPLALRLVAGRATDVSWIKILQWLLDEGARRSLLKADQTQLDLDHLFTIFIQDMSPKMRKALYVVVSPPSFSYYDASFGQAVWRDITSKEAAEERWNALISWQVIELQEPEQEDTAVYASEHKKSRRYCMHKLIYDYLQVHAKENPNTGQIRGWIWRYSLREAWPGWRAYWACVPALPKDLKWSILKPWTPGHAKHCPGPLLMSATKHAEQLFWRTDIFVWQTTALEYVVLARKSVLLKCWVLMGGLWTLLGSGITISLAYAGAPKALVVLIGILMFLIVLPLLGIAVLQWRDIQRLIGWRLLGCSPEEALIESNS